MKGTWFILLIMACGCSQEFSPFDPESKPIPIVFGFVDTNDSLHCIRLTKTFTSSESAQELAKNTANFLYDSVRLIVECLDEHRNVIDSLIFSKTYFTPPLTTLFGTTRSWYYTSRGRFPPPEISPICRLKIVIYDCGDTVTSKTAYTYKAKDRVRMVSPSKRTTSISLYNDNQSTIDYSGLRKCGIKLRLNYLEVTGQLVQSKRIEQFWPVTKETHVFQLSPSKLFMFVRNNIPEGPDPDYRTFHSLDIIAFAGPSDELMYYNELFYSDRNPYSGITFFDTEYCDIINGKGIFLGYTKNSVTNLKFDQ